MAIVKGFVEAMGLQVSAANNEDGPGPCFTIRFRRKRCVSRDGGGTMKGPKIVIVNNEAAIRRLLRSALERAGYSVVEASTARQAQNAMDIDRPDAVLLDLGLPDREGLELVPVIAKSGAALLVISAREATSEKITALDLGADDYVTKPFDTDEVLARLRRALRQRVSVEGNPILNLDGLEIDLLSRRVRRDGQDIHLSPKEYGVLAELARYPGRVLTHAQLLQSSGAPPMSVTSNIYG